MSTEATIPTGTIEEVEGVTPDALREQMLKGLPSKTLRKRAKQIVSNDPETPPEIGANSRTIPGIITQRGCTYAGCRALSSVPSTTSCTSPTVPWVAGITRG